MGLAVIAEGDVADTHADLLIPTVVDTASFNNVVSLSFSLVLMQSDLTSRIYDRMLEHAALAVKLILTA